MLSWPNTLKRKEQVESVTVVQLSLCYLYESYTMFKRTIQQIVVVVVVGGGGEGPR